MNMKLRHLSITCVSSSFSTINRNYSFNSRYKFTAKELDNETNYSYFGARYYDSDISIWLSVDPLAHERSWLSPYNYCQWNPIGRVDPDGALDSEHVDKFGNIIASYDDGDNSVYMHSSGTTQSQIDKQRATMNNTGGSGQKIGELGW
jgi:RHS repeat-associated protein